MKKIVFLTLCLVLILTSAVLPTALTVAASEPTANYSEYDYSKPGSSFNTAVSAADVLEQLGFDVSDAEREYLNAYCDFKIHYDRVLNDNISKEIIGNDGEPKTVKITAEPYTYEAVNGQNVTWIPNLAKIVEGTDVLYETDSYTTDGNSRIFEIENVIIEDNSELNFTVQYKVDSGIEISAEDSDYILNFAYRATEAVKFYDENKTDIVRYYEYLLKLEAWNEYQAYLDADRQYREDYAKFQEYEQKRDEYQQIKDANEQKTAEYNAALDKYNKYLADKNVAMSQLEKLDNALFNNKVSYLDRQLYSGLFSSLVDTVVANQDEITSWYVSLGPVIEDCAEASDKIHNIFEPENGVHYKDLKTFEEKYAFYRAQYEYICDYILLLGESLYKIYTTDGIKALMHLASEIKDMPDYTEKLVIFISQLLCLSEALNDSEEPLKYTDGNGKKYTLDEIRFNYRTLRESVNDPEYKNKSIEYVFECKIEEYVKDDNNAQPISLVVGTKPVEPELQELPDKPTEVREPTPPAVVEPVDEPVAVNPVDFSDYSDFNAYDFTYNTDYENLLRALSVSERTATILTYYPVVEVKRANNATDVEVAFNDENGNLIYTTKVEQGCAVRFDDSEYYLPTKAADISATYVLDGWKDSEGNPYDLFSVTEDVILYPNFKPNYRSSTTLGGYTLLSISENLTKFPISYFASKASQSEDGKKGIRLDINDVTVILKREVLSELIGAGVSYLDINTSSASISEYSCSISAYDASGNKVNVASDVPVYLPSLNLGATVTSPNFDVLTHIYGGVYISGKNYLNAKVGEEYNFSVAYKISNSHKDKVNITKQASPGETVTFTVNAPVGQRVEVYYILNGENIPISGDSFIMPEGNIQIGARLVDIEYVVKFESDGKILTEQHYKHGETLQVPNNPTKINDGKYSYKFTGWSPVLADIVTGDVTYVAQFEATPLEIKEKGINWFRVILIAGIVVVCLAIIGVVLLILFKSGVINIKGKREEAETREAYLDNYRKTSENGKTAPNARAPEGRKTTGTVRPTEVRKPTENARTAEGRNPVRNARPLGNGTTSENRRPIDTRSTVDRKQIQTPKNGREMDKNQK